MVSILGVGFLFVCLVVVVVKITEETVSKSK